MKMVMISYNEAIETEVMDSLARCAIKNYTKITNVYGSGLTSGTHLGNDVWPGKNSILYVACEDKDARQLMSCIRESRKTLGREGVKAFLLPLEDMT
jgi:nitrogen regulatory protein PII